MLSTLLRSIMTLKKLRKIPTLLFSSFDWKDIFQQSFVYLNVTSNVSQDVISLKYLARNCTCYEVVAPLPDETKTIVYQKSHKLCSMSYLPKETSGEAKKDILIRRPRVPNDQVRSG